MISGVGLWEPEQQHVCSVIARIEECLSVVAYLLKK